MSPWGVPGEEIPGAGRAQLDIITTAYRPASAHRAGHHPAGEEHASIAGRVRDLIGPTPNRRPGTPTGSAPAARQIWQPSDPTDRYPPR